MFLPHMRRSWGPPTMELKYKGVYMVELPLVSYSVQLLMAYKSLLYFFQLRLIFPSRTEAILANHAQIVVNFVPVFHNTHTCTHCSCGALSIPNHVLLIVTGIVCFYKQLLNDHTQQNRYLRSGEVQAWVK